LRYIGSKDKVLEFIESSIVDTIGNLDGATIADLFCGTTTVAQHFKRQGAKIISNDYMTFSYAFQVAYIRNNEIPTFDKLANKCGLNNYQEVLQYLNDRNGVKGFFFEEYTKEGTKNKAYQRNYFSEDNAIRIDSIRSKLEEWYIAKLISQDEYYILITSLIDAVTKVSNTSGTYGAFLKFDEPRKSKRLELEAIDIYNNGQLNECYCEDIFDAIKHIEGDVLYLDPPYNSRQYPPYYHILETVTLYDKPAIYGKTGRRPYNDKLSPFCMKNKVSNALFKIVAEARFNHIFISYSTDGLLPQDEIMKILSPVGKIDIFEASHRRYKSNSNGEEKSGLKEILIYVNK